MRGKPIDTYAEYLSLVNLDESLAEKRPNELSGGQRQRDAIARVLSLQPRVILADEPVSSLDVSVRLQILDLLAQMHRKLGVTLAVITHDISTLPVLAKRVCVMYSGEIVEEGPIDSIIREPLHPYTKALVAAIPDFGKTLVRVSELTRGEADSETNTIIGCKYSPRCPYAAELCRKVKPTLTTLNTGRKVACHIYSDEFDKTKIGT
ncbi:MAG: ABC transporter ATP-binding protein [Thermoprotei archaeon]